MFTALEYLYLLLPIISGYGISAVCSTDESAGQNVKFRPPGWVFGVVWPILYIMLGVSWVYASRESQFNSIYYCVLTLLLTTWVFVYSCKKDKQSSVYILLASIIASFTCFSTGTIQTKLMISPLIGWLIFALLMNTTEIQSQNN